jgi:DUF2075 family protein
MRLYEGLSAQFITDAGHGLLAPRLRESFFRQLHAWPSRQEVDSWANSLRAAAAVFDEAGLDDHAVLLEYQLPLSSQRLDCVVCGRDREGLDQAVIIELKQWQRADPAEGANEVVTWLGHTSREVLHPSVQVDRYRMYLEDTHSAFHEGEPPVLLSSCAYLHNYTRDPLDAIFQPKFSQVLGSSPVFTASQSSELEDFLAGRLEAGQGAGVLQRIDRGSYSPSKKLLQHVAAVIRGQADFVLLDDQLIAYDKVVARALKAAGAGAKSVILIKGGPGTGKSVIAINLMAELLARGYNAHYATGSKAFTTTLREIIGSRGAPQLKYFNSYIAAAPNSVDVLICDEAHRIRESSNSRFTRQGSRSVEPQVDELLRVARVAVFLVDDKQTVRPNEIGSSDYILEHAAMKGCDIAEYELQTQFRCGGSADFIAWVDNTLGIEATAVTSWQPNPDFDFRILKNPWELELAIQEKVKQGHSGRLTAGFCWPWSDPNPDGTLVEDVVIGNFHRPWNAKPDASRLARGIPKAPLWAYDPNGIGQVGCIYTAQGFEFDYVGVIFGTDLVWNPAKEEWEANPRNSHDSQIKRSPAQFSACVKNVYRVLLSRGMKGCYVCFLDTATEALFRGRIEA